MPIGPKRGRFRFGASWAELFRFLRKQIRSDRWRRDREAGGIFFFFFQPDDKNENENWNSEPMKLFRGLLVKSTLSTAVPAVLMVIR